MNILFYLLIFTLILADSFLHNGIKWLEFLQDLVFSILGALGGILFFKERQKNQKPPLIDSEKLKLEVNIEEKRQLEEKIKTLEATINKLLK